MEKNESSKKDRLMKLIIPVVVAAITVSVLIYPEIGLKALPLYFSIGIMALNANANRLGFLLGGLNSIIYGFVFLDLKLYGSVINALLVSAPFQLITFAIWSKNKYKHATIFKKLSKKQTLFVAILTIAAWLAQYFLLMESDAEFLILDNTAMVLGTLCTILSLLSYKEYAIINLLSGTCTLILYLLMLPKTPSHITYVIFQTYALFCICKMVITVYGIYREQQLREEIVSEDNFQSECI